MLKKIIEALSGIPAVIVSSIFLFLDFLPHLTGKAYVPFHFAWITVVISGLPLLYHAIWKLVHLPGIRKISSALLITLAMLAAIAIGDLFAAGEVAWIMAIGEILEELTTGRAKKGLKKLIALAPTQGRRITDGQETMIAAEAIQMQDILRVLPGETIPVDGVIIRGETSVDQSVMTGESLPVDKAVGDTVYGGTINRFGAIDLRATNVGADSTLQKLIRMVQEAEEKKAPMARVADQWASWLVPVAFLIAVITLIVTQDIVRAVTVLVVFCPCALVLATPTAIMAAIGQATKHGVIIKSEEALERMGKVDTVAFDKTGTLTYGRLAVSDVIALDGKMSGEALLSLTASLEAKSEHPLGKAIVAYAQAQDMVPVDTDTFTMEAGKGIAATIGADAYVCGHEKYFTQHGIVVPEAAHDLLARLREAGKAIVLVAKNRVCIGLVALSDVLRPEAGEMIGRLGKMHTQSVLLTGDHQQTADYFARQMGLRDVYAELLPEEKVARIAALQAQGRTVCMIGDGVNDAPALKMASVGVAMGSMGSDIAVEAADIALMQDDLSKIPYLKCLSNATVRTIQFGITLSMVINLVAVVLSVLGWLNPTTGALVHNAGSCLVILIAALLYDRKFQ